MKPNQNNSTNPPLKDGISSIMAISILISIFMLFASLAGLLFPSLIYPAEDLVRSFVPNDLVNLVIGLPVMLVSLQLVRRGKLMGLLLWPGSLFFIFYNYMAYVIAMPFNLVYLVYLLLAILSIFALVILVGKLDAEEIRNNLKGLVKEGLAGGVLMALGLLFAIRAMGVLLTPLFGGDALMRTDLAVNVVDALITPTWVICGVMLWRRKPFGYISGLGILFQGSMLFIALIVYLLVQPFLTSAPFVLVDVLVVTIMGLICFIPFILFIRGVLESSRSSET